MSSDTGVANSAKTAKPAPTMRPVSSSSLSFFAAGKPIPKARPRMTKSGHTYTPKTTMDWEGVIAQAGLEAMRDNDLATFDGPLEVMLTFFGARVNADIDNLAKACLDAMNSIVYYDDKQVNDLHIHRGHKDKFRDGVQVIVTELP